MRWKYKLIEKSDRIYIYAYSRETDDLDGVISYDLETKQAQLIKPCKGDERSNITKEMALEHFWKVINEGFPEYRYVCCG